MLKREEIARIKEMYPKGTPIRLYSMEGEQSVPPGSRGVVDHVDDIGQIHMKWENGSCLALNIEVDRFDIITQQDDISEKKEQEFIDKVNEILDKTDFLLLNMSCNTENTSYAAETLLAMHQAFEEVYGEGYVDEKYGMVMMPAVVKGTESGIKALALVTLDLESSGEHWGTTFLTPVDPKEHLDRLTQLLNKTNQFNLTTRRYTREQMQQIVEDAGKRVFLYQVTDAFGDNGIVAAAIVDTDGELPEITDLVMSCRVMGRNIENAVIDRIEEQMQEEGYTGLRGRYIPTAKNKPVEALYEKLGYHRTESTQEGGTCYEITLAERPERAYWLKETLYD